MSKDNNKIEMSKFFVMLIALILLISIHCASAAVSLVNPENNACTNQEENTFEYYISIEELTECKLIMDSDTALTNDTITNATNPGFNEFVLGGIEPGEHTWSITCDSANGSESSEERTITYDRVEPTIVLFNPQNNIVFETSSVELSFVALDNLAEIMNCSVITNSEVNQFVLATNSQPLTVTIDQLSDGNYTWKVACVDYANNIKESETRSFTVLSEPPLPDFRVFLDSAEYATGQSGQMSISAPAGTSVRVEVCPNQTGFVECKVPINAQNITEFPLIELVPYTNYAGKYILEAFFNYSGITQTQEIGYKVNNNINIDIATNINQRRNVPVQLKATATGGVGDLNYTWQLSNGTRTNASKVNITYSASGNYTNTVFVEDAYNNTMNKSVTVYVENTAYITIRVKDSKTNSPIAGATVEVEEDQETTDANGEVNYYLEEGRRDILVLRENYSVYNSELNITSDETITILLNPITASKPIITLLLPENNSPVIGPEEELVYKVEYDKNVNCSIYINENNDGFFIYLGSDELSSSSEQRFGVIQLENKSYWWKVECIDKEGNSAMSSTWKFNVGAPLQLATTAEETNSDYKVYNDWIKEFEQVYESFSNLPKEEKEAADALGIQAMVDEGIQTFKNTIRDIDSLRFRSDLTDSDKQEEGEKYVAAADQTYQKTPVSIQLLGSDAFVDYIKKEELQSLLEQYLEIKGQKEEVNLKDALTYLDELQQEIVISTKVKTARVMYRDGTQSDSSIIIREIKAYNITSDAFIIELIPKDVAGSAEEIMSQQKFEVIKQDPIIKFDLKGDSSSITQISYYFNTNIDSELLKNIRTAVFIEPNTIKENSKITGFSVKNLKLPKIKGIIFLPVIIILLGSMVFAGMRYDGVTHAKHAYYRLQGRKSLHYINVVLSEIHENLSVGDLNKACELYSEAKGAYAELPNMAKNDVYEKVAEAASKISDYYQSVQSQSIINELTSRINHIQQLISYAQLMPALEEYKSIEQTYNQFSDAEKELLHPALVEIGNKIQIMIDNTKNLI
ncbi:PKD domain-containing protein [Candidatus Woesearchaeota archaeon]|nr:PKD domain-containing protein [Candidatus Woesearchaeota archaeon]